MIPIAKEVFSIAQDLFRCDASGLFVRTPYSPNGPSATHTEPPCQLPQSAVAMKRSW